MKLSICTTGFKEKDIEEVIEWARPLSENLKGLEIWIGHIERFQEKRGPLDKLARLLETNGLQIPVISGYTTFSKGEAERRNDFRQAKRMLDVARQLNCPRIRTFVGHIPSRDASPELWAETVAELVKVAQIADLYEVDVAVEIHYDTFADNDDSVRTLLQDIAHPRIQLIFDAANLNVDQIDPMKVLDSVYAHVRHVHLKNYKWNHKERYKSTPVSIFSGDVDNRLLLQELQKRQYDGFVSLEYFGEKGRPALLASLKEWDSHFAKAPCTV
jgi:3-dehydroshikimate dehydratase